MRESGWTLCWTLFLVACSTGTKPRDEASILRVGDAPTTSADAAVAPGDAPIDATPSADAPPARSHHDHVDHELKAMQAELGVRASSCHGVAKLLGTRGSASVAHERRRVQRILRLCVEDRWPRDVRDCVARADHDPMSCTSYLTTARQRARWNVIFDRW